MGSFKTDTETMKVSIVGGGLGGLGCAIACRTQGFDVTVYEKVREFMRLGDSIGLNSNSSRLMYRWGCGEQLEAISSTAKGIVFHNFNSFDAIGWDGRIGESKETYGSQSLIGHRGDYHLILLNHARKLGVDVRMGTAVVEYNTAKPSIILESGEEIVSDVVICAEGVKSKGREPVLGYEDNPIHSGYAVYRGFMDGDLIRDDPVAGFLVEKGEDSIHIFLAPDMHGFIVTLRNGKEVNSVLTHKDVGDVAEGWAEPGNKEDILKLIPDWAPEFVRLWEKMPNCVDWKLVYRPCLDKWVADSGLITLMGDAAHPFLPTSTQGASQAIEDGATIALCLAKAGKGNVPLALRTFFEMRHDYVAKAQATGIEQRQIWHSLHDKDSKKFKETFDVNAAAQQNYYLWEMDAEKYVEDHWEEVSSMVAAQLKEEKRT